MTQRNLHIQCLSGFQSIFANNEKLRKPLTKKIKEKERILQKDVMNCKWEKDLVLLRQ